jgi:RNase H-fold protein (predicted Holliday junction resolvase)
MRTVLAIDPGRGKCGLAVVTDQGIVHKSVVSRADVVRTAAELAASHPVDAVIVGNGTGGGALADELRGDASIDSIELVDEALSTRRARSRYFEDNPPRGMRRLIPRGLLTPAVPYDDYVAVILAEDYLSRTEAAS